MTILDPPRFGPVLNLDHLNPVKWFYERLAKQIAKFEQTLKPNQSTALAHPMLGGVLDVREIGYHGPDMIVLRGVDSQGQPVWLVLHLSLVQLTITVVAQKPNQPERRIGFLGQVAKDEHEAASE